MVGVDHEPQPNYPFPFVESDALEFAAQHACEFDVTHASPPCQRYTTGGRVRARESRPDLVGVVREILKDVGAIYVIENVPGAPLRWDALLCGSHFGLQVRRHRVFESNMDMPKPPACDHSGKIVGVYGHPHGRAGAWPGMLPSTVETWKRAMGIDWMTAAEMSQAIPPAYTEFIGKQLIEAIS